MESEETGNFRSHAAKSDPYYLNQCFDCQVIRHPKILAVITEEGTVVQCSSSLAAVTGYQPREWLGRCLFDFIHPDERIGLIQRFRSLVDHETPYLMAETRMIHHAGKSLWVEFISSRIRESASGKEVIVVHLRDIGETKRKEAIALRSQNLDAIGDLAAGMAHEFNNVLTAILGNISLVKHAMDRRDISYQRLENAEQASKKAANIARQLLTFSRGGNPVKEITSLENLVQSAVAVHRERYPGFAVEILAHEGLWPAELDEEQISLVIAALLENACEATPVDSKIAITLENNEAGRETAQPPHSDPYVRMTISDRGHGIPPDIIGRIFDPYFTTRSGKRGMGLTIAYSIIRKHDGLLSVQSEPGNGTTVIACLPAALKMRG